MKIGFIGLGKMGGNMVERLLAGGHNIIAYDVNKPAIDAAASKGAEIARDFNDIIHKLESPKVIWSMLPAGEITDSTIDELSLNLQEGDIIIDGGNSFYKDSIKNSKKLKKKNILFLDAGTSGGIWGLKEGYCLMVGGEEKAFKHCEKLFSTLAPENGYAHVGPSGSGHYTKMIHNGIEYAMLQAYGEGFEILKAKKEFNLDLHKISKLWNNGSVVRSWLLELSELAFKEDPELSSIEGYVEDSGEGRWTVAEAMESNVPAPVITISLIQRFASRQKESFSAKVIAALRNQFGGHGLKKK